MYELVSVPHDLTSPVKSVPHSLRGLVYRHRLKRIGDVLLALFVLPIAAPSIVIMYFLARSDGGPGFYGHRRVGKSGQMFKCWKIRTMVPDAEKRLGQLLEKDPQARAAWDRDRKLHNDPRVTRFGRFLRQSSLDELPQIWNVLWGDMSLVGPRPVTRSELKKYGMAKRAYLGVRPGITGLWQVSGRNDVSYAERVKFDITYHDCLSWSFDTGILLRTIAVVMKRNGL